MQVCALIAVVTAAASVLIADAQAPVAYGPGKCVNLARSNTGTCVISTDCETQNTDHFEFAFDCMAPGGQTVVLHSFGSGGFDATEEFDTEVKCESCLAPSPEALSKPAPLPKAATAHLRRPAAKNQERPHNFAAKRVRAVASQQAEPGPATVKYGPKECVSAWKNKVGRCVMQTKCEKEVDTKEWEDYEFGLVCVDKAGMPVRHLFGKQSFDVEETFDTLIVCEQCLALTDIPSNIAINGQVMTLAKEIKSLKDVMGDMSNQVDKLEAKVSTWDNTTTLAPPVTTVAPPTTTVSVALVHHKTHHREMATATVENAPAVEEQADEEVDTTEDPPAPRPHRHPKVHHAQPQARARHHRLRVKFHGTPRKVPVPTPVVVAAADADDASAGSDASASDASVSDASAADTEDSDASATDNSQSAASQDDSQGSSQADSQADNSQNDASQDDSQGSTQDDSQTAAQTDSQGDDETQAPPPPQPKKYAQPKVVSHPKLVSTAEDAAPADQGDQEKDAVEPEDEHVDDGFLDN